MSRVRIAYLTTDATVHDRRFLALYAGAGHEVVLLRLRPAGQLSGDWLPAGCREESWLPASGATGLPALVDPLRDALSRIAADVVHAGPLPTCAWLAARAGASPLVSMSWGSDVLLDAALDLDVADRVTEAVGASAVVQCDCAHTASVLVGTHGADPADVVVFPWGVDLASLPPRDGRRDWPTDPEAVVVASFRSWEAVYGVETAVRAFAAAADRDPRLHLVLGGAGSMTERITMVLGQVGHADRIRQAGRMDNPAVHGLLRSADIYLSASLSDGTSISLLEAMATGLPAVVTDIPCNREWIDAEGGALAPSGDVEAFADALVALAADPAARERAGQRNMAVAARRADWPACAAPLIAAVEAVASV